MKNEVVPIQIRGLMPANTGCAIFVGNDEKVFVIQVEHNMGAVIGMFLKDQPKERPLTHDLINSIFKGFDITVDRAVITELKNSTYYAPVSADAERARAEDRGAGRSAQRLPVTGLRAEKAALRRGLPFRAGRGYVEVAGRD